MKEDATENQMRLMDLVQTRVSITCDKCLGVSNIYSVDDFMAAERFSAIGWKAISGKVYCPQCASK